VTDGRSAWMTAVLLLAALTGCDRSVTAEASADRAAAVPESADELEPLLVDDVPSGLPRLPDDALEPPAGEKTVTDVAAYAEDISRERDVLQDYGYRFGWERFWGEPGAELTSVFVHQLEHRAGAAAYARDAAANEADFFDGILSENPPELPGGCRLLIVEEFAGPGGMDGPAVSGWCGHGVFTVSVTSVAGSIDQAQAEVSKLLPEQLDRLPPG
jgi:hypothetical protein